LLTTAERHPALASLFEAEARRLTRSKVTLVHGDYSPKNLLTDGSAVKIIDAEVAWFGDPAFDIAFLINHLLLKAIRFPERAGGYAKLHEEFLQTYKVSLSDRWSDDLEARSVRLILMLMLARISGKSPVEYFTQESPEARFILKFSTVHIHSAISCFYELFGQFQNAISDDNYTH
jgi:thiamine kinase-like enzyme